MVLQQVPFLRGTGHKSGEERYGWLNFHGSYKKSCLRIYQSCYDVELHQDLFLQGARHEIMRVEKG